MKKCKICGNETTEFFTVNLRTIHICSGCATAIFIQQATYLAVNSIKESK